MADGVVVRFDAAKGFGFIRSGEVDGDVFVHVAEVPGRRPLRPGQHVRFAVEATARGPRAVRVEPGRLGLSPFLAGTTWIGGGMAALALGLHAAGLGWIAAALGALNLVTVATYGWDKRQATRGGRRVPEAALLALALGGGSPGAAAAMVGLRHKTRKGRFLIPFAAIVAAQVALGAYLGLRPA